MDGYYHISHVENAPQNVGKCGKYEGVAANMFAVVCKISKNAGANPILGFDELFEDGIIVDGTGADLAEIDKIMKSKYLKNVEISS